MFIFSFHSLSDSHCPTEYVYPWVRFLLPPSQSPLLNPGHSACPYVTSPVFLCFSISFVKAFSTPRSFLPPNVTCLCSSSRPENVQHMFHSKHTHSANRRVIIPYKLTISLYPPHQWEIFTKKIFFISLVNLKVRFFLSFYSKVPDIHYGFLHFVFCFTV